MSESNRVSIKYVPETVYNTTPVDSEDWQYLRRTNDGLTAAPQTATSNEIRSDRQVSDQVLVGLEVGGNVDVELSADSVDDFMEAALGGAWTADVLNVGTNEYSFSIEKTYEDLTQNILFTGMRVGNMSLSVEHGAIATGSFTFAGSGSAASGTSAVGGGSVADVTTTEVLNGSVDVTNIQIDGSDAGLVQNVALEINNNLRPINALGSLAPTDQSYGRCQVTGTVNVYFNDIALYNKALTNDSFSLSFQISDGTNSYTFSIPKAKASSAVPEGAGADADVMLPINFTAVVDDVTGESLSITRV